ncbi:MAG TPA: DUF4870 domain-containing protein [Nocardioidaceae bacterium]|jgi:uncharacterized Tic20 family protein|nr:DUF4870 domain-containing protein [Nocardioidaceae bacterium]
MSTPPGSPPPPPPPGGDYQPQAGPGAPYGPTSEERTWALIAHVGTLVAAWFAMGFLCPLVVMLVKGNESPFVRRHAVESLNFQISLLIYLVVSAILIFLVIGIFMLIALGIFALVVIILATVAASNGRDYRYPLTIRMVK